jgi:hypothetical protein
MLPPPLQAADVLKAITKRFGGSAKVWLRQVEHLLNKDEQDAAQKVRRGAAWMQRVAACPFPFERFPLCLPLPASACLCLPLPASACLCLPLPASACRTLPHLCVEGAYRMCALCRAVKAVPHAAVLLSWQCGPLLSCGTAVLLHGSVGHCCAARRRCGYE